MLSKLFPLLSRPDSTANQSKQIRRRSQSTPSTYEALEPRSMLAAVVDLPLDMPASEPSSYEAVAFVGFLCLEPLVRSQPSVDPAVGAVVTAFVGQDPENPEDSYDVLTGWLAAVDELHSIGANEVSFGVYRQVEQGVLSGGPSVQTVATAVAYANQKNLSVTILPVFETAEGWRGDYDPEGAERATFQSQYSQWISELAQIEGVDRLNIGSELNQMVANPDNAEFFAGLIGIAEQGFVIAGNESGRIGYAANHDAFSDEGHRALFSQSGIDFIGISAYRWLTPPAEADAVAGTNGISPEVFDAFVENWTDFLDDVELVADEFDLPVVIQEVGAVQRNYASVAPFAVEPGDFVADDLQDRYAFDPTEQEAIFKSIIVALDGRGDTFESVTFWTWEHQASRGRRTTDVLGTENGWESFAIYPDDGGGGEFLADYLSGDPTALLIED